MIASFKCEPVRRIAGSEYPKIPCIVMNSSSAASVASLLAITHRWLNTGYFRPGSTL